MLSYQELILLPTFMERYNYLKLSGSVGEDKFGYDRYLNQSFYASKEWRNFRNHIIVRDMGNDMALEGYAILGKVIIHHLNPLEVDDFLEHSNSLLDPNNVVCVSYDTHQAIHYGSEEKLPHGLIIRTPNDTCPWR